MDEGLALGKKIMLLVTIVSRGKGEKIVSFLNNKGVTFNFMSLGRGTASSELLDYLGLGETKKDIIISTALKENTKTLLNNMRDLMNLNDPGKGIAFVIDIKSVGGPRTLGYMYGKNPVEDVGQPTDSEVEEMEEGKKYELILTIVNRGFADNVMSAAKDHGATGGTVLYARGAGIHEAEKFFGISIHPEKEVVLILVESEHRREIMQSICEKSGLNTEGKGLTFSIPVDDVAGIVHDKL